MSTSDSSPVVQNAPKSSWLTSCVVIPLVILFVILGIYDLVFGSILAYVFSSVRIFSLINIAVVLILACDCFIYFFLAFRIKRQRWFISVALLALVWLILPVSLRSLINKSTARIRVDGYAMGTTLPDRSYVLADRLAYQKNEPQRGDIILFNSPFDANQDLIKRVIGLPGETIAVKDGIVTINDTQIKETYITEPPMYEGSWAVPEGQYFVLGDNRNNSKDSHQWGFLPRENITARAVWVYYPLAQFGKIVDVHSSP